MSNNPSESDNNLEQADASDVNVNQSFYLDTENLVLSTRQNNLLRTLGNMANIIEFDLMRSSSSPRPVANNILLAKFVNQKAASTREISGGKLEVDLVCQLINKQFNIKTGLWQVCMVVNITKYKQDIYAIAVTNTDKSLVYQSIPVIIDGSVLVISPTIALIKDQVKHNNLYNYAEGADV